MLKIFHYLDVRSARPICFQVLGKNVFKKAKADELFDIKVILNVVKILILNK